MSKTNSVIGLEVEEIANAKLTTRLHVVGTRADGYHLLDCEMVSLDTADKVFISDGEGLEIIGRNADGVPADETNIVVRALHAVGRSAHIRVEKNIPHGGGLGGGSADAAAVFRWSRTFDYELAAKIGADVPFCLRGGRAHVSGIGEVVEPLPFVPAEFTLLMPPFGVNTQAVFKTFDRLGMANSVGVDEPNHLEAAAIATEPRLAEWKDVLFSATGQTPILAGSGSTWFVHGLFDAPNSGALNKALSGGARWIQTRATKAKPLE